MAGTGEDQAPTPKAIEAGGKIKPLNAGTGEDQAPKPKAMEAGTGEDQAPAPKAIEAGTGEDQAPKPKPERPYSAICSCYRGRVHQRAGIPS